MNEVLAGFLSDAAEARDVTDLNIAAGAALQELQHRPNRTKEMLRKAGSIVASVIAFTLIGDAFAASPIHAGIDPFYQSHIFTRDLHAKDWGDIPRANLFGFALPWRADDGWLERLLR